MSQQGKGAQEGDYGFPLLIAFIVILVVGLYHFFHAELNYYLLYFKYYELKFINFFFSSGLDANKLYEYWTHNALQGANISKVDFRSVQQVSHFIGVQLMWPFVSLGVFFSAILYFFHPNATYRETESMDSLREKVKHVYPCIQVVSELDLANEPIDKGPWAMGLTPIEFAKRNKLLVRSEDAPVIVDEIKARIVLADQLGSQWVSVDLLSQPQRAIFAALCLFIDYKRDEAEKLLEQFASSASKSTIISGKLDYTGVDKIIDKYMQHSKIEQILQQHKYVYTVFSQMIVQARSTGIIATSTFLWLKPMDRKLWYSLNNVGRKAVYIETGAVTAHWLAEVKLGYSVKVPLVGRAVEALVDAVANRVIRNADEGVCDGSGNIFEVEMDRSLEDKSQENLETKSLPDKSKEVDLDKDKDQLAQAKTDKSAKKIKG